MALALLLAISFVCAPRSAESSRPQSFSVELNSLGVFNQEQPHQASATDAQPASLEQFSMPRSLNGSTDNDMQVIFRTRDLSELQKLLADGRFDLLGPFVPFNDTSAEPFGKSDASDSAIPEDHNLTVVSTIYNDSNASPLAVFNDTSAASVIKDVPIKDSPPQPRITIMAAAADIGWLQGLRAIFEWDEQNGGMQQRLWLNSDGANSTPLLRAIKGGHDDIVRYLLDKRAYATTAAADNQTPLELSVRLGHSSIVSALLHSDTDLADGLANLRVTVKNRASKLPNLAERWPVGNELDDHLDKVHEAIPVDLRPSDADKEVVGRAPDDWLLLYMNQIMYLAASCQQADEDNATRNTHRKAILSILSQDGYAAFAINFQWTVVALASFFSFFGLALFIVCRVRIYGDLSAPLSLAQLIPGAFDPIRVTDPDFDPSRQRVKLPYQTARSQLVSSRAFTVSPKAFGNALLGTFSSWWLLFVRIPPETDIYDEDYASDDDDISRLLCRRVAMSWARWVRLAEVAVRNFALLTLLWWLAVQTLRWEMIACLVAVYLFHALVAAVVARSTESMQSAVSDDESGPEEESSRMDAARLVHSLFDVQHGPRWPRAISTTRSTSLLSKRDLQKYHRRRLKVSGEEARSSAADSLCLTSGSESFQRALLQQGVLQTQHGDYLVRAVFHISMTLAIVVAILYIRPALRMAESIWESYFRLGAVGVFTSYGAPGSLGRCSALLLELLLISFICERICSIITLLDVVFVSLQQRRRAIAFAKAHSGSTLSASQLADPERETEAEQRQREAMRDVDFCIELSGLRWQVLKNAVAVVLHMTLVLQLCSVVLLTCRYAGSERRDVLDAWEWADPVTLAMGNMLLFFPLLPAITMGALANDDIRAYTAHLIGDNHFSVKEIVGSRLVRWPGGMELGYFAPASLSLLSFLIVLLAAYC